MNNSLLLYFTFLRLAFSPHISRKNPYTIAETLAIDRFLSLRLSGGLFKEPSTSEFLDWIEALMNFGRPTTWMPLLRSPDEQKIPFRELLFKVQKDWGKFSAVLEG